MKRFAKIPERFLLNEDIEIIDYEQKKDFDDTYIVDTSGYVPNNQAVQVLNRQFAVSMMNALSYDLPDAIKHDAVNLFARRKGIDIAELSQHQETLKKEIERCIDDAKAVYTRKFKRQASQQAASSSAKDKDNEK